MSGLLSSPQRRQAGNGLLSEPVTVDKRVAGLLNLDPEIERGSVLPIGRDAAGNMVMAWPQMALDTIKSLMLPGHVMQGGEFTPRDVTEMALDVGMLSSVAPAPAGAKRMFGGINAKNAPVDDLAKAEVMEKAGEAADDIWRATGWGRGADGKWRFEIDDSGAKSVDIFGDPARTDRVIGASVNAKRDGGQLPQATSIDDVLTHPELSRQYGSTPEGGVFFDNLGSTRGKYHGDIDAITLDDGLAAIDPAQTRSTSLHELQHAIQRREGFAKGGNQGQASQIHEKAIQNVADVRGKAMNEWFAAQPGDRPNVEARWRPIIEAAESELQQIAGDGADPLAMYRRLAGEVEARNVQTRMDMDAATRRATPPWATEDVPRDQQILRGLLKN
jgi:hypothetical protein